MSLIGTISEHLIRFFSSSSVNLSDNYMQGELSIHAVRLEEEKIFLILTHTHTRTYSQNENNI